MRILLAEDDQRIAESLAEALAAQHYIVDVATDGEKGWDFVRTFAYDLCLLDVILPELDGISLCQRVRSHGYQMPILLVTARDATNDIVTGLDAGADDYVRKPYKLQELLARIRALLRRGNTTLSPVMEWGSLQIDPNICQATYEGKPLHLTPKEYRLLELLLRRNGCILSRSNILENLWSFEEPPEEDAVKAIVKRLRQKLKAAGAPSDFVATAYGMGYYLQQRSQQQFRNYEEATSCQSVNSSSLVGRTGISS
ncbi:response regulator transcription factor [Chlorogloeopsis sp. ULAP01]|uniref:response regulator transcription factor n=1 Tax=Chlorogloeopsis sp. ULAP01 TaxID=3056483 RepID=UPI0025AAFDE4|nr:response regulator transcription factor [Chlorogloeopsis sp. ULAP01]MDM9381364.1 response regulator transcription factor [Chlorogloeopsis sp. ULAP01]